MCHPTNNIVDSAEAELVSESVDLFPAYPGGPVGRSVFRLVREPTTTINITGGAFGGGWEMYEVAVKRRSLSYIQTFIQSIRVVDEIEFIIL